jgi:hypothetical protein
MVRVLAKIAGLVFLAAQGCAASIIVTYASTAGQQATTAQNANTYTFNSLSTGLTSNVTWTGIGSFNKVWTQPADQYGGAGGTGQYAAVGSDSESVSLLSTTLTLTTPQSYVGVWISALDQENQLTLYSGSTQLASFNVGILENAIGSCTGSNPYCGNPNNTSEDPGEPFAYLNFFAQQGTTITSVVFSNLNNSTSFEYDNVSVSTSPGPVTGTVLATYTSTPEPGTWWTIGPGLLLLGGLARWRGRAAIQRDRHI